MCQAFQILRNLSSEWPKNLEKLSVSRQLIPTGKKQCHFKAIYSRIRQLISSFLKCICQFFWTTFGTGKVSSNNGKVRTDDDRHHNSLKGVWKRIVRPVPPVDKDLKRDKIASKNLRVASFLHVPLRWPYCRMCGLT